MDSYQSGMPDRAEKRPLVSLTGMVDENAYDSESETNNDEGSNVNSVNVNVNSWDAVRESYCRQLGNIYKIHPLYLLLFIFTTIMLLGLVFIYDIDTRSYNYNYNSRQSDYIMDFIDANMDQYLPEIHSSGKKQKIANDKIRQNLNIPTLHSELYHDSQIQEMAEKKEAKSQKHHHHHHHHHPKTNKLSITRDAKPPPPPPPPSDGCETTVLIVRHCEKTSVREHCDFVGYERAIYLSTLFGNQTSGARWPVPSKLYALSPGERNNKHVLNYRERETLMPLGRKVNVTVDSTFGLRETKELTDSLFESMRLGEMCGKIAVICWKHDNVPSLALQLGCGPENGCPTTWKTYDFDSVWQIKYSYHRLMHSPFVSETREEGHEGKKKKGRRRKDWRLWAKYPMWWIYGSRQEQGFDPLAFSKEMGDYPEGGRPYSGDWLLKDPSMELP